MGGVFETCEGDEVLTGLWWGNLREKDSLADIGIEGRALLKWILRRVDGRALSGLMWFRMETYVGRIT